MSAEVSTQPARNSVSTVYRLVLFNGLIVEADSERIVLSVSAKRLLAYFALRPGSPSRKAVACALWPDILEQNSTNRLRTAIWRLHCRCPGLLGCATGNLGLAPDVLVDVQEFKDWARAIIDPTVDGRELSTPDCVFHGDLLPGWSEDWVVDERYHLHNLRMHSLEMVATRLTCLGRYGEALEAAYACVDADTLRESAHRVAIKVHLAEGNNAAAIRQYEAFRRLLGRELGVPPTPQITSLIRHLRPVSRL